MTGRMAPLVLFDLDGTLVDTAADLCAAANVLRADAGFAALDVATLRPAVSRGSRAMLEVAFPHLDAAARDALVPRFLECYSGAIALHSRLFPGMTRVLEAIETNAARWGIVTNKPEALARALVAGIGLAQRCAVLVGGDTLAVRKPDPEPLRFAARHLDVDPRRAVYVGDDARDVEAARAAGMKALAAAWGYRDSADRIDRWGADRVLESPVDLLRAGALSPLDLP